MNEIKVTFQPNNPAIRVTFPSQIVFGSGGGGGGGDMFKSVYDPDNDGKVTAALSADVAPWSGLTGKPSDFTPSTHAHPLSDVTQSGASPGQVAAWNGAAWIPTTPSGAGSGDMLKSTYDPNDDGVVSNSAALGGVSLATLRNEILVNSIVYG